VQTSLLQAQIFVLDSQAERWVMEKDLSRQAGNNHPTSIPTGVFKTSDGYINIATTGGPIWERCAQAIGAPELASNPDFATAPAHSKMRCAQCQDQPSDGKEKRADLGHRAQRPRALRSDLFDRPDVRRRQVRISASARMSRATRIVISAWFFSPPGVAHTKQDGCAPAGIWRA
jgi:hypothetical protein